MPVALILSSYVAASRVGGMAQALALAALGIEPVLAPTVLFGRHPGRGAPGGGAVSDEMFEGLLGGLEADGVFSRADFVITGYFASAEHVRSAARVLGKIRRAGGARIVVDPIMGDEGRLYVAESVAEAIAAELVPHADLVAPNAWELERLSGNSIRDARDAVIAARSLGRPVLVSSVPAGEAIGVVYADGYEAWLATHPRAETAPHGVGDLLTALFTALFAQNLPIDQALALAVGSIAEAVVAARDSGVDELSIVGLSDQVAHDPTAVRIERLV
jgi:pyridoxine kinase